MVGYNTKGKVINCYNIGILSGQGTSNILIGGICASNGYSNHVGGKIVNSYYLDNTNYAYYYYSGSFQSVITRKLTQEKLKNAVNLLGQAYVEDNNNSNNGYPILKWRLEK